ncbi:hypothetical protein HYW42_02210 [Candidatus Daviesbacteria bacterium]|nr:hypothetical protein [Candidatus Daviesbacteria bacterium]
MEDSGENDLPKGYVAPVNPGLGMGGRASPGSFENRQPFLAQLQEKKRGVGWKARLAGVGMLIGGLLGVPIGVAASQSSEGQALGDQITQPIKDAARNAVSTLDATEPGLVGGRETAQRVVRYPNLGVYQPTEEQEKHNRLVGEATTQQIAAAAEEHEEKEGNRIMSDSNRPPRDHSEDPTSDIVK